MWEPSGIITFLSDYGWQDSYVAQVKGVLLSYSSRLQIVDITHSIPPQDIFEGAFQLATACSLFPAGTVHLAIVDPGVGTSRRAIAVLADRHAFVLPDNGLLTLVLREAQHCQAWELDRPGYFRKPLSATFHGRDLFAPIAAALATGTPPDLVGSPLPLSELVRLPLEEVRVTREHVTGPVVSIDRFGNCRTLIRPKHLEGLVGPLIIRCGALLIHGIKNTFANVEPGETLALFGSHGGLELAVREGSAAGQWGITRGMLVHVAVQEA